MTCSVFSHTLKPAVLLSAALCEKIIWMSSDGWTFSAALTWICWEGKGSSSFLLSNSELLLCSEEIQTWGKMEMKLLYSLLPP